MLRLPGEHTTPHGLAVSGTVWRWRGLQVDATGSILVTLLAFPSKEVADAMGTSNEKSPLDEGQLKIQGMDFLMVVGQDSPGNNLAERISNAIYKHARDHVPMFADAEDV